MEEHSIWTEKYRPKEFSEMCGQEHILPRIAAFVKQRNMPHLLFSGPAGTGKTTLAMLIATKFFKEEWHSNFIELNASDERGIDIIRNKVKDFARTRALGDVPFKIIYLDECDALTKEAQQALRRTMENFTRTCRFILSCNYSSKIIEPIQSRCAVFRFRLLSKENILHIIENIAKNEGLKVDAKAKEALFVVCDGDCRKLENIMQSCAVMSKTITEDAVHSMSSIAKPEEMLAILELALKNQFIKARETLLDIMLNYGLAGLDVIKQIQKEVLNIKLEDKKKMMIIEKCGEIEFRMVEGSDEFIQLEALLAFISYVGSE
jgi:replication factor C small subunit